MVLKLFSEPAVVLLASESSIFWIRCHDFDMVAEQDTS